MALSAIFERLGRTDPFRAHQWLLESGLDEQLERRLRARLEQLLREEGAAQDLPAALARRALVTAVEKAAHFDARQAPDFLAWLESLARPEIEQRWFLGFDERVARGLQGVPFGQAEREEISVWAVGRAIDRLDRYEPARGSLLGFVLGIAYWRARDLMRRGGPARLELELDRLGRGDAGPGLVEAADLAELVFEVLRGCSRVERLVFRARLMGVDYGDIAARLGYGVPSTHNVMNRVREHMRRRLRRLEREA